MPIPTKDRDAILIMARHLRRGARSTKDLSKLMNISQRTVYRWIRHLEGEGHDVISRRNPDKPGRMYYSILVDKK